MLSEHRQERGLAYAGTGEDSETLTTPTRCKQVEGANAQVQPFAQIATQMSGESARLQRIIADALLERRSLIERMPKGIHDPSEPGRAWPNNVAFRRRTDLRPKTDTGKLFIRQKHSAIFSQRHDFGKQTVLVPARTTSWTTSPSATLDRTNIANIEERMKSMTNQAPAMAGADLADQIAGLKTLQLPQ
jgi:hypothetical protein